MLAGISLIELRVHTENQRIRTGTIAKTGGLCYDIDIRKERGQFLWKKNI